jgi:MoaA/NifB/PqqE/SkfB family radical SAM enzyme
MKKATVDKVAKFLIPAPLIHVARRIGLGRTLKMLVIIGSSYIRIFFYLFRKRGLKAAWIFLSVKLFTPVGPGGAGFFWFLARPLIRRFPMLYRFPRQLELEITTECSKKCIHCEHTWWSTDSQPRQHMRQKDVIKILEQFPNLRWVSLVGEGSSFEHPEMLSFIKYVKRRQIMCYMVDHLSDWTDETIKTVLENDLDGVLISLDAATKTTYENLKVGCNFDNVTSNIKKLINAKKHHNSPLPEILFSYIAMKRNVHEIPDLVDLIASLGTRKDFGAGSRIGIVRLLAFKQILHLQVDDIPQEIFDETQKRAQKHDLFVNFTGTNIREDLPDPSCCLAWMEPYIFMGGYISQCCAVFISNNRDFIRNYALGNVLEEDFEDHWNAKPYMSLRRLVNKPDQPIPIQCAGCRVFNTLPREKKYGIINTHTDEIMTLETFYNEHMGANMRWRYKDLIR